MKVSELIERLARVSPDATVTVEHACQGFPVTRVEDRVTAVALRGPDPRCPHGYPPTVRCSRCGE